MFRSTHASMQTREIILVISYVMPYRQLQPESINSAWKRSWKKVVFHDVKQLDGLAQIIACHRKMRISSLMDRLILLLSILFDVFVYGRRQYAFFFFIVVGVVVVNVSGSRQQHQFMYAAQLFSLFERCFCVFINILITWFSDYTLQHRQSSRRLTST